MRQWDFEQLPENKQTNKIMMWKNYTDQQMALLKYSKWPGT